MDQGSVFSGHLRSSIKTTSCAKGENCCLLERSQKEDIILLAKTGEGLISSLDFRTNTGDDEKQ